MKKLLFAAILVAGAALAGSASAAPLPAPFGLERNHDGGQIEMVRRGGGGWHRGWGKRHYGWRRGRHRGWRRRGWM